MVMICDVAINSGVDSVDSVSMAEGIAYRVTKQREATRQLFPTHLPVSEL
jgi:hypothetical protein